MIIKLHIMFLTKARMLEVLIVKLNGWFFLIEDDDSLEKFNTIWDKINSDN